MSDQTAIATVIDPQGAQIDRMIDVAMKNKDIERMEKFYEMKLRYEADEARKAYVAAMAAFKAEPIEIKKDRHVYYTKRDGSIVDYFHASIGNVVSTICSGLGKNGFSHRWDTKQEAGKVVVACVITHAQGHQESTVLSAEPDASGNKNSIQAIASTVSYLQRYTLLAATGTASSDMDDDGRASSSDETGALSDPEQDKIDTLYAKIKAALTYGELEKLKDEIKVIQNVDRRRELTGAYNARQREFVGAKTAEQP
jgi:ERF superfamily